MDLTAPTPTAEHDRPRPLDERTARRLRLANAGLVRPARGAGRRAPAADDRLRRPGDRDLPRGPAGDGAARHRRRCSTCRSALLVAAFLALAALDHLVVALPRVHRTYERLLSRSRNPFRWAEYSVSSTLMVAAHRLPGRRHRRDGGRRHRRGQRRDDPVRAADGAGQRGPGRGRVAAVRLRLRRRRLPVGGDRHRHRRVGARGRGRRSADLRLRDLRDAARAVHVVRGRAVAAVPRARAAAAASPTRWSPSGPTWC